MIAIDLYNVCPFLTVVSVVLFCIEGKKVNKTKKNTAQHISLLRDTTRMNSTTQLNRTKRGEVYQLPDNKFTFVCVHCLKEFQHFTEFTLHVQIHLHLSLKQELPEPSVDFDKLANKSASVSTKGQLIASSNIKVIDESDDDFEFMNHVETECKDESSSSVESDCRKTKKTVNGRKFECFICHKQLASLFVVRRHMTIHKHNDLKCKNCDIKFRTSRYYERHNCMSHPNRRKFVSQMPVIEERIEKVRIYECAVCKRIFRDRRQLQNHMTKHKQSPCLCLICGKLFTGDRTLSRHMKLHNSSDESHPCTECGRKFKQRRYLLDHNRKVHNLYADEGQAICEICDQQFQNKRLLQIHKQTHPFVEKRNFPCTMCSHSAKCAYDLRRHIETHSIENRSFECPICHRKLLPRYANDHMKSHDLTRSFECKECGKQFTRAKTLKRHENTHQKTLGNGPTFKCDVCSKLFARMDGLLRHRRRHSVAMNFHCRICNKGFIEQKSFLFHEANHTKGLAKGNVTVADQIQSK